MVYAFVQIQKCMIAQILSSYKIKVQVLCPSKIQLIKRKQTK